MKNLFSIATLAAVFLGFAVTDDLAAGISTSRSNLRNRSGVAQDSSVTVVAGSNAVVADTLRYPDSDDDGASTSRLLPTVNKKTTAVAGDDTTQSPPGMAISEQGMPKKPDPTIKKSSGEMEAKPTTADSIATP